MYVLPNFFILKKIFFECTKADCFSINDALMKVVRAVSLLAFQFIFKFWLSNSFKLKMLIQSEIHHGNMSLNFLGTF